eukprot:1154325-Pelagomonas_calceolata.AAC.2
MPQAIAHQATERPGHCTPRPCPRPLHTRPLHAKATAHQGHAPGPCRACKHHSKSPAMKRGGSMLAANKCTLEGGKIGLQVERKGAARLTLCKINSQSAPAEAPELPPAPRPGFLPDFQTTAAGVEVRHEGSYVTVIDSKVGLLEGQLGELGVHCIAGGRFFFEAGVALAMEGVRGQFQDFV